MLEQVSLLPNKMRHVGVCNTLWKSRFNKISDKVRRRIVRDVQVLLRVSNTSSLSRQPRKHMDKKVGHQLSDLLACWISLLRVTE